MRPLRAATAMDESLRWHVGVGLAGGAATMVAHHARLPYRRALPSDIGRTARL